MSSFRKALVVAGCCLGLVAFHAPDAIAKNAKVEVCHIPPGNPDNAHTITISENALQAHLDHGDHVGACESDPPPADVRESGPRADSACICPRPGVWRVTNLDGWMECNALGIKRKLKGA